MHKAIFLGSLVTLLASPALGQSVSGQDCIVLANTIAAGYTNSFSDRDFNALRYYASCEARDASSGGGLTIGYSAFSLGGNYAEAHSSQLCQQSRDSLGIHDVEYNTAKVVFDKSLPTIDRCLELANRGWSVKYNQVGADAISLVLSYPTVNGAVLLGAKVIPPNSLNCSPDLPTQPMTIKSSSPYSTTCYRTPNIQLVDGIQITSASDATVDLILEDGPFLIPLKGYESSVLPKLERKIEEGLSGIRSLLPKSDDFYLKQIASRKQHSEDSCGDDILVSAACTNDGGAQAAVGPKFFERDNKRWASCDSYNSAGRMAEGTLICMKHR